MSYVYVASSWRNTMQPAVIHTLRAAGIDCYDFRNPAEGDNGFRWTDVGLEQTCRCAHSRGPHGFCALHGEAWNYLDACDCPTSDVVPAENYLRGIEHPVAVDGYRKDLEAMEKADTFVLVLPCGRSAHLELGWAVGAGKRTAILLDDPCTPELMYRMVDHLATSVFDLLGWLGVED